jgi:HMG (high mobility group) box
MRNDLHDISTIGVGNLTWDLQHPETPKLEERIDTNMGSKTMDVDEPGSIGNKDPSVRQHRKGWKKPVGMPKRPMSSYNLFFQLERERLVNDENDRVFTPEDIDRVAKVQKLKDLSCHKRKHRKSHGKISFSNLARVIAEKWKSLDDSSKSAFFERAAMEKEEYKVAVEEWARSETTRSTTARPNVPSPTHGFLTEPIESPPQGDELYGVQQTDTTPEIAFPTQMQDVHQEIWNSATSKVATDQMTLRNMVDGRSWIELGTPDRCSNMAYSNEYQQKNLDRIHYLRNLQSPPRTQLQPRSDLFNTDYMQQSQHSKSFDDQTSILLAGKVFDEYQKRSPSSAFQNIYSPGCDIPLCTNYDVSTSHHIGGNGNVDSSNVQPHLKMMRSRSFPLGEKHYTNDEIIHPEYTHTQLYSDERYPSHPNLCGPASYTGSITNELAGLPLDSLVEVSPGHFIDPSVYNVDCSTHLRNSHQFVPRRSTFSGGYSTGKSRQDVPRMAQVYRRAHATNHTNHVQAPDAHHYMSEVHRTKSFPLMEPAESQQHLSELNRTISFPPVDVVTVRRGPQRRKSYEQDFELCRQYDHDNIVETSEMQPRFTNNSNLSYFNEVEERVALDLVSLAGHQSQRSNCANNSTGEGASVFAHHHQCTPTHDDRDASESNAMSMPLNYNDDRANHWEV